MNFTPVYHIICEGKSEVAYIQELNRYIRENELELNFALKAHEAAGGEYDMLIAKYEAVRQANRNAQIAIWCDKDLYIGNRNKKDKENAAKYQSKPRNIPDFTFNTQNFEDFLIMHLPDEVFSKWHNICNRCQHFAKPLTGNQYVSLLNRHNIFKTTYVKGTFPPEVEFSDAIFQKLKLRNSDKRVPFSSDFIKFLQFKIKLFE